MYDQFSFRNVVAVSLMFFMSVISGCEFGKGTAHQENNQPNKNETAKSEEKNKSTNAKEQKGVLVDYRKEINLTAPRLTEQTTKKIVQAVFGQNYTGNDVAINSMTTGAFTAAGENETVYLLQRGGARAADPNSMDTVVLALFKGDNLQGRFNLKDANFIIDKIDLNGDGINELLLQGSFYNTGELVAWATLGELKDGKWRTIKEFKDMEDNSCDGGMQNAEIKAGVVFYGDRQSDGFPLFDVKYYRAKCTSKGKPDIGNFTEISG